MANSAEQKQHKSCFFLTIELEGTNQLQAGSSQGPEFVAWMYR